MATQRILTRSRASPVCSDGKTRELSGASGTRMGATESKHNETEGATKKVETKIRTMDAHFHSVAAVAGAGARVAMTTASNARGTSQEVGDRTDELERRARALEISPKHEQASSHTNGDVPREQRATLVIVGFPRDQKQDAVVTVPILLQERGFEVKEVYSPFRRTELAKVKCNNTVQASNIMLDSRENAQGWARAYNGERVQL